MTDGNGFDLQPPRRTRTVRHPTRRSRPEPKDATATASAGRAARLLWWLVSPGIYLFLGLVFAAGLLLCLDNPSWGVLGLRWPHEVYALQDGLFVFGPDAAHVTAFLLAALACLVGLLLKPGPYRGVLGVLAAVALLAPYAPQAPGALWSPAWAPTIAMAAVAAALVARHGGHVEGRRRMLLGIGVLALGAALFFPGEGTAYSSAGLDHFHAMTDGTNVAEIVKTLPQSVGILLLVIGLAALLGLGGSWARWAGGFLVLLLAVTIPVHAYVSGEGAWSARLAGLAKAQAMAPWVWLLPLTAGLAELLRPRR
jgi:hypothetical protein